MNMLEAIPALPAHNIVRSVAFYHDKFGFAIAHPDLISGMEKVKDSYNCDTVAIAAATAALQDQDWMLLNRSKILATRDRLAAALPSWGFTVHPSEANFLWVSHVT